MRGQNTHFASHSAHLLATQISCAWIGPAAPPTALARLHFGSVLSERVARALQQPDLQLLVRGNHLGQAHAVLLKLFRL